MSADGNGKIPEAAASPDLLLDRETFDFALDAHLLTDAHGIVLDANAAAGLLLQCRREFVVGKPLGLFVSPQDRPAFYLC